MEKISSVKAACALALGWLAGRDLSAAEIRQRLRRRDCPPEIAEQAIEQLRSSQAIDDERVAMSRARVEAGSRGRGRQRVLLRLRSIGIDNETAARAVNAVFGDIDEADLLERALARRLKATDGRIHSLSEYRRLHDALARQGFQPGEIRRALDRRKIESSDFWSHDE